MTSRVPDTSPLEDSVQSNSGLHKIYPDILDFYSLEDGNFQENFSFRDQKFQLAKSSQIDLERLSTILDHNLDFFHEHTSIQVKEKLEDSGTSLEVWRRIWTNVKFMIRAMIDPSPEYMPNKLPVLIKAFRLMFYMKSFVAKAKLLDQKKLEEDFQYIHLMLEERTETILGENIPAFLAGLSQHTLLESNHDFQTLPSRFENLIKHTVAEGNEEETKSSDDFNPHDSLDFDQEAEVELNDGPAISVSVSTFKKYFFPEKIQDPALQTGPFGSEGKTVLENSQKSKTTQTNYFSAKSKSTACEKAAERSNPEEVDLEALLAEGKEFGLGSSDDEFRELRKLNDRLKAAQARGKKVADIKDKIEEKKKKQERFFVKLQQTKDLVAKNLAEVAATTREDEEAIKKIKKELGNKKRGREDSLEGQEDSDSEISFTPKKKPNCRLRR